MIRIGIKSLKLLLLAAIGYMFAGFFIFYAWTSSGSPKTEDVVLFPGEKEDFSIEKELRRLSRLSHFKPTTTTTTAKTPRVSTPKLTWIKHRTFLTTRIRCTQKFPLLILVPSRPLNFKNRKVIRQTWGTDHNMNKTWKTMFLLGQAQHPAHNKYLITEAAIHGDIVQGIQTDAYYNLTLKVEMGLEWAVNYCDFDFLLKALKADDDVFIDPFNLVDYLRRPQTPKSQLYLGNVARRSNTRREGKWGLSYEEYSSEVLPKFCNGPAYVLSRDLVRKIVEIFDTRHPLKLEDVYMGMLAKRLGVMPRRHRGFKTGVYDEHCLLYPNLIAMHEASVNCIAKLFNQALEKRFSTDL